MATLGKITAGLIITATAGAVVAGILSIPDIRRYFKIRQM